MPAEELGGGIVGEVVGEGVAWMDRPRVPGRGWTM